MTVEHEEFLDALVDQMVLDFSDHGGLVQRRSGEVCFRGTWVYYRKVKDMLVLVVNDERHELPLF